MHELMSKKAGPTPVKKMYTGSCNPILFRVNLAIWHVCYICFIAIAPCANLGLPLPPWRSGEPPEKRPKIERGAEKNKMQTRMWRGVGLGQGCQKQKSIKTNQVCLGRDVAVPPLVQM